MASRMLVRKLQPKTTALLLCDMQEKFRGTVSHFKEIVDVSRRMLNACSLLDMKVIATEQYPKGLGATVAELGLAEHKKVQVVDKTTFSMCVPRVRDYLKEDVKSVLLCGIEGHACVYQTAIDLLHDGYDVHVVVDAVSSRSHVDRMFALRQMEKQGAMLTTSECAILALLRDAKHPLFRDIQKLIMDVAPDSGLSHI